MLANGKLERKLTVKANKFSETAKKKLLSCRWNCRGDLMFTLLKNTVQMKEIRTSIIHLMILIIFRIGSSNGSWCKCWSNSNIYNYRNLRLLNTFSGGVIKLPLFSMEFHHISLLRLLFNCYKWILPTFVEWSKQGEVGRRKLNTATRYLTIVIDFPSLCNFIRI